MKKVLLAILFLPLIVNAQIITTVAGSGPYTYSGEGGPATIATIDPEDVYVTGTETMYIADNYNSSVYMVTPAGIIRTFAGNSTSGYGGDNGPATAAQMYNAMAITMDATGNVYVVDQTNQRIRKINTSGIITTFAGTGFGTGTGIGGYNGDGIAATTAQLYNPSGIAADAAGNIYISDAGNHRIRKVNTSGIISTVAGIGSGGFYGDGGQATAAQLYNPVGIAIDPSGNLYIADMLNNRVRKVNAAGIISTIAGSATPGYYGDGTTATTAGLHDPAYVAISSIGNLYISDATNHCVRKVNSAGIISTFAGNNTPGFSGDGGLATAAELYDPYGLHVDGVENVFIADEANHRVRKVSGITGGSAVLCANDTSTFTAAVPTGTWTSSNTGVATVNLITGLVTGVSGGTATITFTGSGGYATAQITILPLPNAGTITGPTGGCIGTATTLNDTVTGGFWSLSNSHAIITGGVVTGLSAGADTVMYSITNSCGIDTATKVVTISPMANAGAITGQDTVCASHTITLSDTASGGTWMAGGSMATISSSGIVTGVSAGSETISYTVSNSCNTATATYHVYVDTSSSCIPLNVGNTTPNATSFSLYPNPNSGTFQIYLASQKQEQVLLTLTNILGQKIFEIPFKTNKEVSLNVDLETGIYFVSVVSDDGKFVGRMNVVR